jgi:hypothetical protein
VGSDAATFSVVRTCLRDDLRGVPILGHDFGERLSATPRNCEQLAPTGQGAGSGETALQHLISLRCG